MLVKFNSPRILGFQEKLLIPGINDLPEELVSDMLEDSILAHKFEKGELEILDREDLGAKKVKTKRNGEPSGVDLLLAASDKKAAELAGATVDLGILAEWLSREKRLSVKKVVKAQIAKIRDIKYRDEKDKKTKLEKAPGSDEGFGDED